MSNSSPNGIKDVRDLFLLNGPSVLQSAPVREWHPNRSPDPGQNDAAIQPSSGGKRKLAYIHCDQIEASLQSSDLVFNLLTHGDASVLYGPSNVGKSFFALDLAVHVATGTPYRGKMRVDRGAVIYVTLEGYRSFDNRVIALKKKGKLPAGTPLYFVKSPVLLLEAADCDALVEAVTEIAHQKRVSVRLVVIDTLSRAMAGGDESSSVDMTNVVRAVDKIRISTGAHVMLVHHCGKDAARGARGHSSLRAAIDTEIELMEDTIKIAHVTKQRDLPCVPSMPFALESVELGLNPYNEMVTSCVVVHNLDHVALPSSKTRAGRTKPVPTHEQILELVPSTGFVQKQQLVHDIRNKLNSASLPAGAVLAEMLQSGKLYQVSGKSASGQNQAHITRQRLD